jgi:hypothetical protein
MFATSPFDLNLASATPADVAALATTIKTTTIKG